MPKIGKFLPYVVVAIDVIALFALQSMFECIGVNNEDCKSSPSPLIVIIAVLVTAYYLYKRHKANLPLLPFMPASKKEKTSVDSAPQTITPLRNRIFFGFISFMMMMSYFVMVYHYTKGSDTPPYAQWSVFTLPLLIGLALITLKDEIKLRIHPFWTPLGLLYLAFAWAIVIIVDLPQGRVSGYSLFDSIGEGFWFATGFGLMLSFVGLGPVYKRVFYFILLAFFGIIFGTIESLNQIRGILQQKPIEWDAFLDLTWLASGYFISYLIIVRLIKDRPRLKTAVKAVALFVVLVFLNLVIGQNFISKAFPLNSWQHHWLKGYLPYYKFQCSGADCANVIYTEPYSFCVDGNRINRGNPAPFYDVAQDRMTKGCNYELDSDSRSMKLACPHPITGLNTNAADLPVVECGNTQFEGIYKESGINSLRNKEPYEY